MRQVASDYQINHITVSKAYQELVDTGLVEKRRGLGMFVVPGARQKAMASEREKFVQQELTQIFQRAQQLGMKEAELVEKISQMMKRKS